MRNAIKHLAEKTYKPLLVKYLSTTRHYQHNGIRLIIPPEVFHPGFFFSTKLLLRYIGRYSLQQKTFLELGAGSGLIAIFAAKKNAIVTATDINSVGIDYLKKNSEANGVNINIIHSDLFENIPKQQFDFVAINPPYYKKQPRNDKEYAWYCGENGEYFQSLFCSLSNYIHAASIVLMILCEGCDMEMIHDIAKKNKFILNCLLEKQNLFEKDFIFEIKRVE
jgi:release factor glutamine methyltransferase